MAIQESLWPGFNGHLRDTWSVLSSVMRRMDRVHVFCETGVYCLLTATKAF